MIFQQDTEMIIDNTVKLGIQISIFVAYKTRGLTFPSWLPNFSTQFQSIQSIQSIQCSNNVDLGETIIT